MALYQTLDILWDVNLPFERSIKENMFRSHKLWWAKKHSCSYKQKGLVFLLLVGLKASSFKWPLSVPLSPQTLVLKESLILSPEQNPVHSLGSWGKAEDSQRRGVNIGHQPPLAWPCHLCKPHVKRREIIWLVRILEVKIRKSNTLLLLFFKSEPEWYSSDQELLPCLDGCLFFDPKFKF